MSVLKVKDKNGKWVSIPALNSDVNESSIKAAIPSLIKCMEDTDSPFVTLEGKSIPIGRVATGSYVGTGAGSSTPNTEVRLTFDFKPHLILIKTLGSGNGINLAILLRPDTFGFGITSPTSIFRIEWLDDGVSFANRGSYGWEMNTEGTTYNYIAIG